MKFSIITTSFNSEKTIKDTIESVLSQSYKDIEYIIIDGNSSDNTLKIVREYKERISHIISEKDNGIYDAMNKGITLATGDIVGILNSDDVYYSNKSLEYIAHEFKRTNVDIVWGNILYVKRDNLNIVTRKWISGSYKSGLFRKGWHPPHPSFFIRRKLYEKYGLFKTNLKIAADYELMLRLLEKEKIASSFINVFLVKMRDGGESNWKNIFKVIRGNIESCRSWKILDLKAQPLLFFKKPLRKIKQLF